MWRDTIHLVFFSSTVVRQENILKFIYRLKNKTKNQTPALVSSCNCSLSAANTASSSARISVCVCLCLLTRLRKASPASQPGSWCICTRLQCAPHTGRHWPCSCSGLAALRALLRLPIRFLFQQSSILDQSNFLYSSHCFCFFCPNYFDSKFTWRLAGLIQIAASERHFRGGTLPPLLSCYRTCLVQGSSASATFREAGKANSSTGGCLEMIVFSEMTLG